MKDHRNQKLENRNSVAPMSFEFRVCSFTVPYSLPPAPYSYLSATMGSTLVARRAGM
jgi:hypothetical protein